MRHKSLYLLAITGILLSGCKIAKKPIVQDFKKYPEQPETFTQTADPTAAEIPLIATMYADPLLKELVDSAIANNIELQKFRYKIDVLSAGMRAVQGNNLPDLSAFLGAGVKRFGRYTVDGVGNFDTNFSPNLTDKQRIPTVLPDVHGGVLSNWEIDVWKKLENQRKAALLRFGQGEQGQNLLKTAIVAEIANAYYDLVVLDNELAIVDESIKLQQQAVEIISSMKDVGESNSLAVELSSAQVLDAKALRIEIEQEIIEIENNIKFLVGRYPQPIPRQKLNDFADDLPSLLTGSPAQLLANRPDIKVAELGLLATNADLHVARVVFYPSLNLGASVGLQSFRVLRFINPTAFALNVVGMGVMPLLNQRQLQANLLATKADQQAAYLNYQEKVLLAFNEVNMYVRKLENNDRILDIKTEEVELLRRSISTSTELFKFGQATYLEIITAQRTALAAQIDFLNVRRSQYRNTILLYRSLGGGWK
ncbi:MAG: TolC family protein [Spirosomaceae bacterium]|nr:TolC family protein [Spirosomataceae bacterium]